MKKSNWKSQIEKEHWKSQKIEIMINDLTDKVIHGMYDSPKNRYQNNLKSMKGGEFVFEYNNYFIINVIKEIPISVDHK